MDTQVAYVLLRFPHLTETFIAEEIREVQQQGVSVQVFSLLSPKAGPIHPTSQALARQVCYAAEVYSPTLWLAQIYFMFKSPRRYWTLLWGLMTQPAPKFTWLFKRLVVFLKGVYLAKRLKGSGVQVIHAHFAWLSAAAALVISQLLDLPFTVTSHASDIYSPENDLLGLIAHRADRLITISDHNRRAISALCQITQEDITVVHCGIDLEQFQAATAPPDSAVLRILSVGSLVEKKGHDYLIRACRTLKEHQVNFHCTIVGRGERRAALERLIADLDVGDVVALAGAQEQPWVRQALQNCDVFVLACIVAQNGDRDGIPVAMMEALGMGVPVVSTHTSGIPELVHHQENGLVVPEKDAEALAAALAQLAKDRDLRQRLAANGPAVVAEEFDIRKNARRLVNVFRQLVGENASDV